MKPHLLAHGGCATLTNVSLVGFGFGDTLGQYLSVLVLRHGSVSERGGYLRRSGGSRTYGLILDLFGLTTLECSAVALVLKALRGDQSLDLGRLGVRLLALTLGLNLATDDIFADL